MTREFRFIEWQRPRHNQGNKPGERERTPPSTQSVTRASTTGRRHGVSSALQDSSTWQSNETLLTSPVSPSSEGGAEGDTPESLYDTASQFPGIVTIRPDMPSDIMSLVSSSESVADYYQYFNDMESQCPGIFTKFALHHGKSSSQYVPMETQVSSSAQATPSQPVYNLGLANREGMPILTEGFTKMESQHTVSDQQPDPSPHGDGDNTDSEIRLNPSMLEVGASLSLPDSITPGGASRTAPDTYYEELAQAAASLREEAFFDYSTDDGFGDNVPADDTEMDDIPQVEMNPGTNAFGIIAGKTPSLASPSSPLTSRAQDYTDDVPSQAAPSLHRGNSVSREVQHSSAQGLNTKTDEARSPPLSGAQAVPSHDAPYRAPCRRSRRTAAEANYYEGSDTEMTDSDAADVKGGGQSVLKDGRLSSERRQPSRKVGTAVRSSKRSGRKRVQRSAASLQSLRATLSETDLGAKDPRDYDSPFENHSVRFMIENGQPVIRVQYDLPVCLFHADNANIASGWSESAQAEGKADRATSARRRYTKDEDDLLWKLKEEDKLPWPKIHEKFCESFPSRPIGSLQVHYSSKVKPQELEQV